MDITFILQQQSIGRGYKMGCHVATSNNNNMCTHSSIMAMSGGCTLKKFNHVSFAGYP